MLSRALSLATVTLLIGWFAAVPAQAQNLEAGKSPSQIFAGTCAACHKSPRGLLRTVAPGSLPGFLREHYTTSSDMASLLSGFLISNGATDTRVGAGQARQEPRTGDAEPRDRQGRKGREPEQPRPEAQQQDQAARPDVDGSGRQGRKRLGRTPGPADTLGPAADGQSPAAAENERGPDGRKSDRRKNARGGKPGSEEPPKASAATEEPAKGAPAIDRPSTGEPAAAEKPRNEPSRNEAAREGADKPATASSPDGGSQAGRPGAESPVLRADPVPPVTPAPPQPTVSATTTTAAPEAPALSAAAPSTAAPSVPAVQAPAPPATVTASAPPPPPVAPSPPVAPAGPPAPPISQ